MSAEYCNTSPFPPLPRIGIRVHFRIHYETHYGENMYICGSSAALGCWKVCDGLPLVYTGTNTWEADVTIPTSLAGEIEYKYVCHNDGGDRWESGMNHVLCYDPLVNNMVIEDVWSDANEAEYTSAFKNAVFSRAKSPKNVAGLATLKSALSRPGVAAATSAVVVLQMRATRIDPRYHFCVLGSHKLLGAWDTSKAVVFDDSKFPLWTAALEVPVVKKSEEEVVEGEKKVALPVEYKLGLYDTKTKKVVSWEDGYNRHMFSFDDLEAGHMYVQAVSEFRYGNGLWRGTGVALPVFSLRSDEGTGVGEFPDLVSFIDWGRSVGIRLVQLLPINDTVSTHSWTDTYPYGAISVFALHPMYVRLQAVGKLRDEKLAKEVDRERVALNKLKAIDYERVMKIKTKFFNAIYAQDRATIVRDEKFWAFVEENADWLVPYVAFCALRDRYGGVDFSWWPRYGTWKGEAEEHFNALATPKGAKDHAAEFDEIGIHLFIQWHAYRQMHAATTHARDSGVVLKGDLPIGVMRESADTWVEPGLYNMNYQTGAPPDAFSTTGQNWGFPTYNWDAMAKDGYRWWRRRLGMLSQYFDAFRIDHVLGFFRIWEIPQSSVDGLLGQFSPSWPLSIDDLRNNGLSYFDADRFCKPYIREYMLENYLGGYENATAAKMSYLNHLGNGAYELKPAYATQRLINDHFNLVLEKLAREAPANADSERERLCRLRDGLMRLCTEVLFLPARNAPGCYSPRVSMEQTQSFRDLPGDLRSTLMRISNYYFYERQEPLWEAQAWKKLPALKASTEMLVCGEDLGMVPACVAPTMTALNILSLNVQRMPKDPKDKFFHPSRAPYMSVVTPASHDTSNLRAWWEEDESVRWEFWKDQMGNYGSAPPFFLSGAIATDIVKMHLYSPAMWAIFPLQDLLAMDEKIRLNDASQERINVPATPKHYWRFRFHISIDQLKKAKDFNTTLKALIDESGRNSN